MDAREIVEILNATDELTDIEAKRGRKVSTSVLETVCAFANTPGIETGYLIAGVARDESGPSPVYTVVGVEDADQYQLDVATRCANDFNRPLRPDITVESIDGLNVVLVKVRELPADGKPVFFKKEGLPRGAYLRVGSSDQRCREEDLILFYGSQTGNYDATPVDYTSIDDIDEDAVARYRILRERVNKDAEELSYSDEDLLKALHCLSADGSGRLTVAGIHLFGTSVCLRRTFPAHRVDYIRVPGNTWVPDTSDRFYSVDMRGPLLKLVYRAVDSVYADLPKGFRLDEGELQARHIVLPVEALREAIVNALMHRNYRINSAIQLIRYDNRVEIRSPGYSLKPENQLGTVGSVLRNQYFAAVFHETNLAETKGSGIRIMRRLLSEAKMTPPTFESNREGDFFITRLLLHHFLNEEDLEWLAGFNDLNLSDAQKSALVFVRDVGAIDNARYRQLVDCKRKEAAADLRMLRDFELIKQKGTTRNTYYIPGAVLIKEPLAAIEEDEAVNREPRSPKGVVKEQIDPKTGLKGVAKNQIDPKTDLKGVAKEPIEEPPSAIKEPKLLIKEPLDPVKEPSELVKELPKGLRERVLNLGSRASSRETLNVLIVDLCRFRSWNNEELSHLLKRNQKGLYNFYLAGLLASNRLQYTHPDLVNHPQQAYRATTPTKEDLT
jgi:ATP-dependent DNA helicase RecG